METEEKKSTWRFSRNGNEVHAENARVIYETAIIGNVYEPSEGNEDRAAAGAKRLVEVTCVAGKWFALTASLKDGTSRDRTMNLDSFFSRYVPGKRKESLKKQSKPKPEKLEQEQREQVFLGDLHQRMLAIETRLVALERVENLQYRLELKLDRLLRELGVSEVQIAQYGARS